VLYDVRECYSSITVEADSILCSQSIKGFEMNSRVYAMPVVIIWFITFCCRNEYDKCIEHRLKAFVILLLNLNH